jgi:hypothetical protein
MRLPAITSFDMSIVPAKKLYLFSAVIAIVIIGIITFFSAYQARDGILYRRLTPSQVASDPKSYDGTNVSITGTYEDLSQIQKPVCVPQGGKPYPDLKPSYQFYPAVWGIYDGNQVLTVKVISDQGQEIQGYPNYSPGQQIQLRGKIKYTTSPDYCNLDIVYNSAILETTGK